MVVKSASIEGRSSHANVQVLDCNVPIYLHLSDSPVLALVPQLMIGAENYSEWNRSMKMCLLVKNKISFIDGSCKRESYKADPFRLYQWERCNAMVQPWIESSVAQELRRGIVYSSNAQKDLYSGMVRGIDSLKDGLYILNPSTHVVGFNSKCLSSSTQQHTNVLWHQRLGHAPFTENSCNKKSITNLICL
ncbi:hypothetical protein RND71_031761 [Anisodus tanguticus]|uniref:Retrotransposon Copia-like N-terminal domain-containing protein n=1 Tax=Anisodus tanguticus TaxID=243964 RepID=A0AAE1RBX5_9SOLA|nr:hypothetical protein RND71_031761 [Anisodus tanguticus]